MPPTLDRERQVQQLRRRYGNNLIEFDLEDATLLNFTIACSDPEHNTESLQVAFKVPFDYSASCNKIEMKIVENNIGDLAKSELENRFNLIEPGLTLLGYTKWIDRQLPSLFEKKIKFITPDSKVFEPRMTISQPINFGANESESCIPDALSESSSATSNENEYQGDNSTQHRGTMLSFPAVEMKNIALFDILNLSILVKCSKCKASIKCENICPKFSLTPNTPTANKRSTSCAICGNMCQIVYRPTFGLRGQGRCGYLDFVNVLAFIDVLPSSYRIQCEECSSIFIIKRWFYSTLFKSRCRECHREMELNLLHFSVLVIGALSSSKDLGRGVTISQKSQRLKKEEGIVFGQPLPKNGACTHYSKSFRWLRFPCCGRAYACDICHDKNEDHGWLHAPKQICGFCSNEQNSNLSICKSCNKEMTKSNTSAFWEGGTGTRDVTKMSKKDNKKFKGRRKVKSNAATKKNK
eukprot:NODE_86_length_22163_cov_0.379442.p4 type:complete len:467 gc:universal NODE_86_length_22163_cov_0.379442:18873-20273(+)